MVGDFDIKWFDEGGVITDGEDCCSGCYSEDF